MQIRLSNVFLVFVVLVVSFSLCSPASAFNGERRGFVLGGGLGTGSARSSTEGSPDFAGLSVDLKVGWGLSHKFLVYYSGKTLFFNDTNNRFFFGNPALSASYYFDEFASSWYLTGGLGVRLVRAEVFLGESGDFAGPSAFVGGGYEFARGVSVEAFVIGSHLSEQDVSLTSFGLTLNFLGY